MKCHLFLLFLNVGLALSGGETCVSEGDTGTGDRASGHNLQWTKVRININKE